MKSKVLLIAACSFVGCFAVAQSPGPARVQLPVTHKEWVRPFPGFRMVGNLYYVGTYDLACYLIDTGQGLILINSGVPGSYAPIKANIERLGFKTTDIKAITATHGHWDHVGDLASFQKDAPAARTYMSERDSAALESGGNVDYRHPEGCGILYDPVRVDVKTKPGDHIQLGNTDLTVHQAFGHSPGATTFTYTTHDDRKSYNVFIVNMNGINDDVKLLDSPGYPTIVEDFASTFKEQVSYTPDIWVSSHAGQFNLHQIYKPGDPYDPTRFGDQAAYQKKVGVLRALYVQQLAQERAAKGK